MNIKVDPENTILRDNNDQVRLPRKSKLSYFIKQKFQRTKQIFKNSAKTKQSPDLNEPPKTSCRICLNPYLNGQAFQLNSCKCKFCETCLFEYIKESIGNCNVLPINCPDLECKSNGHFNTDEIKYIIFNSQTTSLPEPSPQAQKNAIECDNNNNYLYSNRLENNSDDNANDQICFIDKDDDNDIETNNNLEHDKTTKIFLFKKYLKICENIEILRDPTKTHCPNPTCQNLCKIVDNIKSRDSLQNVKVTCDKCNSEFCSICFKKWTKGLQTSASVYTSLLISNETESNVTQMSCLSLSDALNDICDCDNKRTIIHDYINSEGSLNSLENIKRCPKCAILIERADGCAQVMCKVCRHTFCFYCLTSLENDFLLKHYTQNGPCKGKLGHSRVSLFFHRISVIAVFSGSLLLLVLLSPFILLTLPCIVLNSKLRKQCFKFSAKFN